MGVCVAFFFVIWWVTLDYYLETFILCLTDTSKKVIIGIYIQSAHLYHFITMKDDDKF